MVCSKCGMQLADGTSFCTSCGTPVGVGVQPQTQPQSQIKDQVKDLFADPKDHTSDYDESDISYNKVFAIMPYIAGMLGVVVALLASSDSKYAKFHARQALKIDVFTILFSIAYALVAVAWSIVELVFIAIEFEALINLWVLIGALASLAAGIVVLVVNFNRILGAIHVLRGKAKDLLIIDRIGIL